MISFLKNVDFFPNLNFKNMTIICYQQTKCIVYAIVCDHLLCCWEPDCQRLPNCRVGAQGVFARLFARMLQVPPSCAMDWPSFAWLQKGMAHRCQTPSIHNKKLHHPSTCMRQGSPRCKSMGTSLPNFNIHAPSFAKTAQGFAKPIFQASTCMRQALPIPRGHKTRKQVYGLLAQQPYNCLRGLAENP